jgi:ABC-2 type transport system permease protein
MTHIKEHQRVKPTSIIGAFLRMDLIEDISYPMSMILHELGFLVPVLIFYFVGDLVGDNPEVGGDYFTFAIIGLMVSTMLQGALSGFGGSLQRAQNRGTFETLLVEPVPWTFLPFAMNIWRIVESIITAILIYLLGWALGANFNASGLPEFAVLVVLGILASTAIGILSASLMLLSKRSQPVLTIYGMAASLLAGSAFSVDQLPSWLQWLSYALPHTYVINSARTVLMDDPGTFSIPFGVAVVALVVFNLVVFTLGLYLYNRSLQYARKMGMLSGY